MINSAGNTAARRPRECQEPFLGEEDPGKDVTELSNNHFLQAATSEQRMLGSVDAGKGRKSHQETNLHHLPRFVTCQVKTAKSPDRLYFCSFILIHFANPFRLANKKENKRRASLWSILKTVWVQQHKTEGRAFSDNTDAGARQVMAAWKQESSPAESKVKR